MYYLIISKENWKVLGIFLLHVILSALLWNFSFSCALWCRASAQLPAQWAYEHSPKQVLNPAGMDLSSWLSPECASQFQGRKQPWASLICKENYSPWVFIGLSAISKIFQRLSKAGFHPGAIPQLCQRLSHLAHLGCTVLCWQDISAKSAAPDRSPDLTKQVPGCAQQATCAGSFCLGLWRTNKRRGTEKCETSPLHRIHSLRLIFCCKARRGWLLCWMQRGFGTGVLTDICHVPSGQTTGISLIL